MSLPENKDHAADACSCCGPAQEKAPEPAEPSACGDACRCGDGEPPEGNEHGGHARREIAAIGLAAALLLGGMIWREALRATPFALGEYLVFGAAYLIAGRGVLLAAGRNILGGQVFDENFLMGIATLGALAIGELPEAASVMIFYRMGEFFQGLSVRRARRSVRALLEVRPDHANLETDGGMRRVAPEEVRVGDIVAVRPGERVPLDGEVIEGRSQLDTSALTGEPVPRAARPGSSVLAGTINQTGLLRLRVTRPFAESSVSRILELVENASARKAPTERFITRFARWYTPGVVAAAAAVALLPPLAGGGAFADWLYRALVLLVISCPCALVISIPLGYFGGVGAASRRGILVKGSNYLDVLNQVRTVVFDKTGTLTQGVFRVSEVTPHNGATRDDLLRHAAHAEAHSNHPIAQSVLEAYGREIPAGMVKDYEEIAGHGVKARADGSAVLAGNDRLLHRENVPHGADACGVEGTVVHVASDGAYAGYLRIADEEKEDARRAVEALRARGVERVIMLTGDNEVAAGEVARALGLDDFRAGLLPEQKVEAIEEILRERGERGKVAFVGDGINDAPVLARADVGIAMGELGSDAAIDTADVVLMTDHPSKVAEAIGIARSTHRIVWQNIAFALGVKGAFLLLGAAGVATMWEAVFADVGVALLAVLNATRALRAAA